MSFTSQQKALLKQTMVPHPLKPSLPDSHQKYLETLSRMTPEERLKRAFDLSEFTRALFLDGLRRRFPEKSEVQIHTLFLERLALCHNRNY